MCRSSAATTGVIAIAERTVDKEETEELTACNLLAKKIPSNGISGQMCVICVSIRVRYPKRARVGVITNLGEGTWCRRQYGKVDCWIRTYNRLEVQRISLVPSPLNTDLIPLLPVGPWKEIVNCQGLDRWIEKVREVDEIMGDILCEA